MDSAMKVFTEICQTFQTINSLKHLSKYSPFKRQLHKMVKHSETIRRLLPTNAEDLFEWVWPFCEVS